MAVHQSILQDPIPLDDIKTHYAGDKIDIKVK
jgi:hypothetical protein